MVITYNIKATGLGNGYNKYPLDFNFNSNFNLDKDDYSHERVIEKAHNEIKRKGFTSFNIDSIEKI